MCFGYMSGRDFNLFSLCVFFLVYCGFEMYFYQFIFTIVARSLIKYD